MNVQQFLNEGLLMEGFDCPHVLRLVGIAFIHGWLPLIVTPYMSNGNLLAYISKPSNVTLNSND